MLSAPHSSLLHSFIAQIQSCCGNLLTSTAAWKTSINVSALRLRNTLWKSLARLCFTSAVLATYLFLPISATLTNKWLTGSHRITSSISQAPSAYLISLFFSLFVHAFWKILLLLREERVKKFYELPLKNEETDIEAAISKNKLSSL